HRVSRSLFVFFDFAVLHRDLHSFPTRRSSDLFFALTIDFMAISFQDWLKLVFYTDFQQTLATKISFLFSTLRLLSYGILLISTSLETYSWIVIVTAVAASVIWWQIFRRRFAYRFVWHRRSLSILSASLRSYGLWDHLNRTVKDILFTVDTVILSWFAAVRSEE